MRLRDQIPRLPHDRGEIDAHNSGFEHSTRYSGIEHAYNRLRMTELVPLDVNHTDVAGISSHEFTDMLFTDEYEVIIAQQLFAYNEPNRLAGVAIGQRQKTGEFATRMAVKELVVESELRRLHIASYLLGRLTKNFIPTEMVVETNRFVPEQWFIDGLQSAGFTHESSNGSPAIWLPGKRIDRQGSVENNIFFRNIEMHMPEMWNGFARAAPNEDDDVTEIRVFKDSKLLGIARKSETTGELDDDIGEVLYDFVVSDAGDVQVDTLKAVTEKEAMIAVLNAYDLVQEAA